MLVPIAKNPAASHPISANAEKEPPETVYDESVTDNDMTPITLSTSTFMTVRPTLTPENTLGDVKSASISLRDGA